MTMADEEVREVPITSSKLVVRRLESDDREQIGRWDAFVSNCSNATFSIKPVGRKLLARSSTIRRIFFMPKGIRLSRSFATWPCQQLSFWQIARFLPFAVYGGIAANTPEAVKRLEDEAQAIARELGVDQLELRNIEQRHPDWPTQNLYVSFRKELKPEVEANMLAIPRKQRAMVRKGIKNGLRSEIDETVDRFFAICRQCPSPWNPGNAEAIF